MSMTDIIQQLDAVIMFPMSERVTITDGVQKYELNADPRRLEKFKRMYIEAHHTTRPYRPRNPRIMVRTSDATVVVLTKRLIVEGILCPD